MEQFGADDLGSQEDIDLRVHRQINPSNQNTFISAPASCTFPAVGAPCSARTVADRNIRSPHSWLDTLPSHPRGYVLRLTPRHIHCSNAKHRIRQVLRFLFHWSPLATFSPQYC